MWIFLSFGTNQLWIITLLFDSMGDVNCGVSSLHKWITKKRGLARESRVEWGVECVCVCVSDRERGREQDKARTGIFFVLRYMPVVK